MPKDPTRKADSIYFKVSPMMLFPGTLGKFSVYLKQGPSAYVLYTSAEERFTERHRKTLYENGVEEVFVLSEHRDTYEEYVEENLGAILLNENIPIKERSRVFYDASTSIVKEIFSKNLPLSMEKKHFERMANFVRKSSHYLSLDKSLKTIASFISHDYQTYSHCVHVFVYTMAVLHTYEMPAREITQHGMGAILHDVGKTQIPKKILNKPERLTKEEFDVIKTHPLHGVSMCSQMPLGQEALNGILFHHEKMDGSGYPTGMLGGNIPLPVRVLTVCDVYDALVSERPYAKSVSPYQALRIMRDEMKGAFDLDVFKRLISILSDAAIV